MPALSQPGSTPFTELTNTDYAANLWYHTPVKGCTPASQASAMVNGSMSLLPFIPRFTHTFTALGWWHNSAAQNGQNLRLGIYGSVGGKPSGAPLVDTGSIATTAAVAFRSATISTRLIAGQMYWLAANADGSLTGLTWTTQTTQDQKPFGAYGLVDPATILAVSAVGNYVGYGQTAAYGALPTIGTLFDLATTGVSVNPPIVMIRG